MNLNVFQIYFFIIKKKNHLNYNAFSIDLENMF